MSYDNAGKRAEPTKQKRMGLIPSKWREQIAKGHALLCVLVNREWSREEDIHG